MGNRSRRNYSPELNASICGADERFTEVSQQVCRNHCRLGSLWKLPKILENCSSFQASIWEPPASVFQAEIFRVTASCLWWKPHNLQQHFPGLCAPPSNSPSHKPCKTQIHRVASVFLTEPLMIHPKDVLANILTFMITLIYLHHILYVYMLLLLLSLPFLSHFYSIHFDAIYAYCIFLLALFFWLWN